MSRRETLTDKFMNEVIIYGGIPMTRANVYRQCLKDTGNKKVADMFAFGGHIRKPPAGTKPVTLTRFRQITSSANRRK